MRSGALVRVLVAVTLVAGLSVPSVAADDVTDQQAKVERIADQLEALEARIGQITEDYGAALDRLEQLEGEIAVTQASVDAKRAELATVQDQLTSIALDAFTAGGSLGLTPLFSSVDAFTSDLARSELSRLALDRGVGDSDEMQALIQDLAEETAALESKKVEQQTLIATLEARRAEGEALTAQYEQEYTAAQAELGQLIREEQERRAAAAIAAAIQQQQPQTPVTTPPRGGGDSGGGGNTGGGGGGNTGGGNNGGGGDTGGGGGDSGGGGGDSGGGGGGDTPPAPPPPPPPPPPSSKSSIAVSAAQTQLGVPYRFAASVPGVAMDCSGLTKYAWGRAGVYLPHQSRQQFASTPHVPEAQAQPGDLIFYHSPISHVGIYIGGGSMIHATQPGDVVKVSAVRWNKVVGVSRPG